MQKDSIATNDLCNSPTDMNSPNSFGSSGWSLTEFEDAQSGTEPFEGSEEEEQYDTFTKAMALKSFDRAAAVIMLEKAIAEEMHVEAMFELAKMLEDGAGVKKDVRRAIRLYEWAAGRGHEGAKDKLRKRGMMA